MWTQARLLIASPPPFNGQDAALLCSSWEDFSASQEVPELRLGSSSFTDFCKYGRTGFPPAIIFSKRGKRCVVRVCGVCVCARLHVHISPSLCLDLWALLPCNLCSACEPFCSYFGNTHKYLLMFINNHQFYLFR